VLIRPADPARDAPACAEIYAPFVAGSAVSFEERPPDAAELGDRMRATMRRYPWLVAEHDETLVGYAYATRHRERAAYRWACETSVYVHAAHRRAGVGGALYRELLDRLRRQGMALAIAGITLPNAASVALHESLGFEPVGVYRRVGYKAGAWRDVGWWQLALQHPPPDPPRDPLAPAIS
jgi:L-amino acid N-acyltransferase YncA